MIFYEKKKERGFELRLSTFLLFAVSKTRLHPFNNAMDLFSRMAAINLMMPYCLFLKSRQNLFGPMKVHFLSDDTEASFVMRAHFHFF